MAFIKMGKTVMNSLFKKPATLMYPVIPREFQERTRGHIEIKVEDCILCGICQKKCPTDAIVVKKDERTWTIERMRCIQCSNCVDVCPKKCLTNESLYTLPETHKVVDTFDIPEAEKKSDGDSSAAPAGDDAKLQCNLESCIYCGICSKKCPEDAIEVTREKKDKDTGEVEGENSWKVDHDACIKCGICVEACPKDSLTIE